MDLATYQTSKIRSSHQRCSVKKVFLDFLQNSQENSCASLFLNKVARLSTATLLKKRPWQAQVFSCEFCKIFKNTYLKNICERLLLYDGAFFEKRVNDLQPLTTFTKISLINTLLALITPGLIGVIFQMFTVKHLTPALLAQYHEK